MGLESSRFGKAQNKILSRELKVCDKTTYASRAKSVSFPVIDVLETDAKPNEDKDEFYLSLSTPGCYQFGRQTIRDYIAQRREMFLAQFSINTKQDAIKEMKQILLKEKKKIGDAEGKLEEDTERLEEFLKETDRNVVEALKLADQETKAKLEKIKETKKVTAEILALKSDIAKFEETLKEYKLYEHFLSLLSPSEWREAQNEKRVIREAAKKTYRERRLALLFPPVTKRSDGKLMRLLSKAEAMREHRYLPCRMSSVTESKRSSTRTPSEASTDERETQTGNSDSEEEPELYFTDPQQLLQIFADLEEQNAIFMKKAQELDEAMQEIKARKTTSQERMNKKIKALNEQKNMLSEALVKEQEQIAELELKTKMFTFENVTLEDQDNILATLKKKITDVYSSCIGEVRAAIDTVQMLSSIENRLGELQDALESLPKEMVAAAQKAKQRERRMRIHQEKLKDELVKQEKRMMRALERATASPCRTLTCRNLRWGKTPECQSDLKQFFEPERGKDDGTASSSLHYSSTPPDPESHPSPTSQTSPVSATPYRSEHRVLPAPPLQTKIADIITHEGERGMRHDTRSEAPSPPRPDLHGMEQGKGHCEHPHSPPETEEASSSDEGANTHMMDASEEDGRTSCVPLSSV
ncbi:coiled-coil domain-containing protein 38 [Bufo gargarizans]|uniref:coiled-coil domain-containing protein 38 n=1 Tax=Bufo gargarizans TaxID=30331 RepID=UPI001CF5F5C6|nr:coiled-coil domain-containing protein 38 [Bufo gargarizans]